MGLAAQSNAGSGHRLYFEQALAECGRARCGVRHCSYRIANEAVTWRHQVVDAAGGSPAGGRSIGRIRFARNAVRRPGCGMRCRGIISTGTHRVLCMPARVLIINGCRSDAVIRRRGREVRRGTRFFASRRTNRFGRVIAAAKMIPARAHHGVRHVGVAVNADIPCVHDGAAVNDDIVYDARTGPAAPPRPVNKPRTAPPRYARLPHPGPTSRNSARSICNTSDRASCRRTPRGPGHRRAFAASDPATNTSGGQREPSARNDRAPSPTGR